MTSISPASVKFADKINLDNYDVIISISYLTKSPYSFINNNSCVVLSFHTVRLVKNKVELIETSVSRRKTFQSKHENGFKTACPFNVLERSQHNILFLCSGFKHIGDNYYFQIDATLKEIMSFYDHGVGVL